MKHICLLFVFYYILFDVSAQKCTLVFRADEDIIVRIFKPIDDTNNYSYISDKLELKPNISISYELEVNDFAFVMCRFSTGNRRFFLVLPDNRIEINYESQKIIISGSNAEGHNYYNDNYTDRGLGYYFVKMDSIFKQQISNSKIKYDSISYYFQKKILSPFQSDLKEMEMSGSISSIFSSMLAKNLYFASCDVLLASYESLLRGSINSYKPSKEDIQNILAQLSQLYEIAYAQSDDSKKMPYNFITEYYRLKYKYSDDEKKEKLTAGYDKDCFGNLIYNLMASDSLQLRVYGNIFIQDLQNGTKYFNHEKMFAYLREKFPDSEYVAIIKKMMDQSQSLEEKTEIIIIKDSIFSIQGLMQTPGIKGKYVYIDLWETACVPCVFEFQFNEDVHKLLAEYNNLVAVYISIDNNRKLWEERVMKYDLKGYNIMASRSLQEDIGMKVYNGKKVGAIPRYILLDPEGNILNDNLPRPSKSAQLKPILVNKLK